MQTFGGVRMLHLVVALVVAPEFAIAAHPASSSLSTLVTMPSDKN